MAANQPAARPDRAGCSQRALTACLVVRDQGVRLAVAWIGLAGHTYWRSISPFHGLVFGGMLRNITAAAERASRAPDKPAPAGH